MSLEKEYSRIASLMQTAVLQVLQSSGHKDTGKLLNSVQVTFDDKGLQFSCLDYVKYLDDGKVLEQIKDKIKDIIKEELPKAIRNEIMGN